MVLTTVNSSSARKPFLAAVTALLHAAERQFDAAAGAVAVDEHLTRTNALGDARLAAAVAGPHRGDEAVVGRVGERDRVGLVFERHHGKHGTEHFVLRERVVCAAPGRTASA